MFPARLALFSLLCVVPACADQGVERSGDVQTPDIQIALTVNGGAESTLVRASASALLPYSGTVQLTDGDRFALHDEPAIPFASEEGGRAFVATVARTRGRIAVDFLRTSRPSILDLGIELPPPFTLQPLPTTTRLGESLSLAWDPSEGSYTTTVVAEGPCVKRRVWSLTRDTGAYVLNGGELAATGTCKVTVSVIRTAPWSSSRGLYAQAMQTRSAIVELSP